MRFAWINVKAHGKPWHITGIRAVCQVKPTNYAGSFACSDPMLTRIWYMAAYGVKDSVRDVLPEAVTEPFLDSVDRLIRELNRATA